MMTKKRRGSLSSIKILVAVPLTVVLFFALSVNADAQSAGTQGNEEVLVVADEMPSYPGGQAALMTYVYKNIKYPEEAKEKGIQGKVTARFVVSKDGSITQTSIVRGVDPLLDNAVLEVLKKLPKFIPGKKDGVAVNVWYALPISFKLAE